MMYIAHFHFQLAAISAQLAQLQLALKKYLVFSPQSFLSDSARLWSSPDYNIGFSKCYDTRLRLELSTLEQLRNTEGHDFD